MKNKKFKLALIILTILIWGIIIVKIIGAFGNPKLEVKRQSVSIAHESHVIVKDTFTLSLKYNDPFLASFSKAIKNTNENGFKVEQTTNSRKANIQSKKILPTTWPIIKYSGQIYNSSSKKHTGLLSINRKEFLVLVKENYSDVYIDEIFSDSISLKYYNEFKVFKKE